MSRRTSSSRHSSSPPMTILAIQGLNALSYGMLLFLLSVGMTLTFGLLRIVNLTHGSYYLVGGYVGLAVLGLTRSFLVGLLAAALAMGLLGLCTERWLFRRYAGNEPAQVLLS